MTQKKKTPSPTSTNNDSFRIVGDPNCPICHGIGFYKYNVPLNHPDFGKMFVCECRADEMQQKAVSYAYAQSKLQHLDTLTFDTFQPTGRGVSNPIQAASISDAFYTAQKFAEKPENWLFLQGGYGCGKTHLAAAITNKAIENQIKTLFLTAPDLLDLLRRAYQNPTITFDQQMDEILNIPLLIIDDFGTQNATDWAEEKIFQIINHRYINHLPLVITSNLPIQSIEGRLRSRLMDFNLVTHVQIMAPDYRQPSDRGEHELSVLEYLGNQTFDTFSFRRNESGITPKMSNDLQLAFEAAKEYAQKPEGWMIFYGTNGSGKTHLAAAIANACLGTPIPPLFVSVPDLLDYLREAFNPSSMKSLGNRFQEVKTIPLLILDDLNTRASTQWAKEKLLQLINYRYVTHLPTIITTSEPIEDLDMRIQSRIMDSRISSIYRFSALPYRGNK